MLEEIADMMAETAEGLHAEGQGPKTKGVYDVILTSPSSAVVSWVEDTGAALRTRNKTIHVNCPQITELVDKMKADSAGSTF